MSAITIIGKLHLRRNTKIALMLLAVVTINAAAFIPLKTSAAGEKMMIFWDPAFGSIPSGWAQNTTYNGRFPRGEAPANFGLTGANDVPRTPTVASTTIGAPTSVTPAPGQGNLAASDLHTHPTPTVTVGADSNGTIPAFRTMQLIEFTAGIPTTLPAGAIVMFDTNGAIPSGFTRVSANDNRIIRVDNTVTTGGNDMASNAVTIGTLADSTTPAVDSKSNNNGIPAAAAVHAHTSSTTSNTTPVSTVPPYVEPLLAQANTTTTTLPPAMVAMFNGDPGVGWQVVSGVGGAYYQKFLRPAATADLTAKGALTHTPPTFVTNSGAVSTASPYSARTNGNGAGNANQDHTHQVTLTFNSVSNIPPYFNVVIAQKVSFTLQAYRWYVESNNQNVTDPWPSGTVNLAQNTALTAVPGAYRAPDIAAQLRLRVQLLVSGQALPASSIQYKLQYKRATDGSCTTGTWTDVSTINQWGYGTNSVADNSALTASQLTPASSVLQLFSKSAPSGTNPNAVATGQTMEYDFFIRNISAASGSQYNIRMIESSGAPLSVYAVCPTLVTRPSSEQVMRHGNYFQDGNEAGYVWAD